MDFRLQKAIDQWMVEKNLAGDCDMISVAGAGKDIVDNPDGFVATQIDLSSKLHATKTVLLMNHMDCGAYGGHTAFENLETERAHHISEMTKAAETIKAKRPDMEVKMILANIDENGTVTIENI
jgi:carbonic anhydrase